MRKIVISLIVVIFLIPVKLGSGDKGIFTRRTKQSFFEIKNIRPDKIFSPNNDGWNDYLEIEYINLEDALIHGKIFDIRGRFVAEMKKSITEEKLIWDGKDKDGNICPSGVYIYQIEITGPESKILNGTCVLVK